jgi:hypothetical protein
MTILGPTSPPRFPIGQSDYALVRRQDLTYVDKTLWIADVFDNPATVLLVPRPRRFGKTLNMTTLRYFAERSDEDRSDLFQDTAVWRENDGAARRHFQNYPVIYLTFKDIKSRNWETCWYGMRELLQRAISNLEALGHIDASISGDIRKIMQMGAEDAPPHAFQNALADMARWCHEATGQPVVILIDEYDAPLHAAWQHGYWDEAVTFFRHFLSAGLKDNPHVKKGVLTGILKVAKEGIFSGLNHLETATVLSDTLVDCFGFTETEVTELATASPGPIDADEMKAWYNGYVFGAHKATTIYNPWSVLSYLKSPGIGPRPFWKNTSDNALIRDLLMRNAATMGPDIETLLTGGTLQRVVDENVALTELDDSPSAVWNLLLFSGYLTIDGVQSTSDGQLATIRIPNREVRSVYTSTFRQWIQGSVPFHADAPSPLRALSKALFSGQASTFERELGALLKHGMSVFDFGHRPIEAIYQAFVVGLLLHLETTHLVRSNRESGFGRADVLITPREAGPGVVLELKVIDTDYDETREQALDRACAQLIDRDYASEVLAAGATSVFQYGVVFDGKRCWVKVVE